jgi:hypothetical protein
VLDPFGRKIESCPNGQLEVGESCVFNIPIGLLLVHTLIFRDFISKSSQLVTKSVFHFMVGCFIGFDSFEETVTDSLQDDSVNIITDGVEGCCDCAG